MRRSRRGFRAPRVLLMATTRAAAAAAAFCSLESNTLMIDIVRRRPDGRSPPLPPTPSAEPRPVGRLAVGTSPLSSFSARLYSNVSKVSRTGRWCVCSASARSFGEMARPRIAARPPARRAHELGIGSCWDRVSSSRIVRRTDGQRRGKNFLAMMAERRRAARERGGVRTPRVANGRRCV